MPFKAAVVVWSRRYQGTFSPKKKPIHIEFSLQFPISVLRPWFYLTVRRSVSQLQPLILLYCPSILLLPLRLADCSVLLFVSLSCHLLPSSALSDKLHEMISFGYFQFKRPTAELLCTAQSGSPSPCTT